jgi:hypothetical protein
LRAGVEPMAVPGQIKTINQIVGTIDPAIVAFALERAPERPLPQKLEWSDQERMVSFLQRLTMFAAMAIAAIATRKLAREAVQQKAKAAYLEKQLFFNIEKLLCGAEFNISYAVNLLNQDLDLTEGLIDIKYVKSGALHGALKDLLLLVAIGESSFANFSRYGNKNIPEIANALLVGLPVLRRLQIQNQGLTLDGGSMFSAFPFVDVDETRRISLLSRFSGGEAPRIKVFRHGESVADEDWTTIPLARRAELGELTSFYGHGSLQPSLKPPTLFRVTEVHQHHLSELASALIEGCGDPDQRGRWLEAALGSAEKSKRIKQIVLDNDTSLLKSSIIKLCLETDPLSVVEAYIRRLYNSGDHEYKLHSLLRAVFRHDNEVQVERERSERDEVVRLGLLDPVSQLDKDSDRLLGDTRNFHKARMLASRIVRRFGFRIEENARIRGINDYYAPAYVLQRYLRSCLRQEQRLSIENSVRALSELYKLVEEVFRVLIGFYVAMKWFDRSSPNGIARDGKHRKRCFDEMGKVVPLTLGNLLKYWDELVADDRLDERLRLNFCCSLRDIPELDSKRLGILTWGLADVRHSQGHNPGYGEDRPLSEQELTQSYLDVVDKYVKLLGLLRGENSKKFRVFPDVVSLHQVRTNRLGIQSHHYVLVREDPEGVSVNEEQITLCTTQPIWLQGEGLQQHEGEMPTVFYALAVADEELPGVWVEPALVPVNLVVDNTSPQVRHEERKNVRPGNAD